LLGLHLQAMLNRATQLLAPQLRETGIAVNVVDPGWCRTDMGGEYAPNSAEDGAAAILWAVVHGSVSKGMTGRFLTARGEERDW
jgi:NAD(P)-dependent dehydrogenase (short-subunit alcohol dehydrogenase family)